MNRRSLLTTSVLTMLAAAVMPSSVVAQEKPLKDQLVGTWIFVSAQDVKPDGTKIDPWGPNPKGVAIYAPQPYLLPQLLALGCWTQTSEDRSA